MDYPVTITKHQSKESTLIINNKLAEKLNLARKKRGIIAFGTQRQYVDIKISEKQAESELSLSEKTAENLYLPTYPIFEIRIKGNEIIVGPCIGILASDKDGDITKRRLKEMSLNTLAYGGIHGAIIVFSLEKVDQQKRLIEGYCYNPQNDSWDRGTFPYPLSIYRRSALKTEWESHFLSVLGDTVFSNYSFSKWDMHNWFIKEPDIKPSIPDTRVYRTKQDLFDMLHQYGVIYVKPIWGMKGFGVIKVALEGQKAEFRYRKDEENITLVAENEGDLLKAADSLFIPGEHIIQKGIELIRHDGGVVDFRCVMQKNEALKWVCSGIIARIGAKQSVVSNISSGGAAIPAVDLIKAALSVSETETFILKEKIISLCTKVCKALDDYGFNYGTLGLDIGIDTEKNVWLIEVNNRKPHPGIALRANDILSYYSILTGSLRYAKALAGFKSEEECGDVL